MPIVVKTVHSQAMAGSAQRARRSHCPVLRSTGAGAAAASSAEELVVRHVALRPLPVLGAKGQEVPLLPLLGTSGSLSKPRPGGLLRRPEQHRSVGLIGRRPKKLIPETDSKAVNLRKEITENDSQKYGEGVCRLHALTQLSEPTRTYFSTSSANTPSHTPSRDRGHQRTLANDPELGHLVPSSRPSTWLPRTPT